MVHPHNPFENVSFASAAAPLLSWAAFWGALLSAKEKPFFHDFLPPLVQDKLSFFREKFASFDSQSIIDALQKESFLRLRDFLQGVHELSQHYGSGEEGDLKQKGRLIWQQGSSYLLDLGDAYGVPHSAPGVLLIPSLLNRGWIFDLTPQCSVVHFLSQQGFRPYVLEWGEPAQDEISFSLEDYQKKRLDCLMQYLSLTLQSPLFIWGYCMGGLMILSALGRLKESLPGVAGVVLWACPWHFHEMPGPPTPLYDVIYAFLSQIKTLQLTVPGSLIQAYFQMQAWPMMSQRMRQWSEVPQLDMLPLERWLHHGYSMAHQTALDCFEKWYVANEPFEKKEIMGTSIHRNSLPWPICFVTGKADDVVPHAATQPLIDLFPHSLLHQGSMGHVGLFSSKQAPKQLWHPVCHWMQQQKQERS